MELEEAIKHCEEVAEEQVKLCKRYDDASGYSRSHNETIRVDDAKKCEKCAEEHRQLAEWLRDYKRLLEQQPCEDCVSRKQALIGIRNLYPGIPFTRQNVKKWKEENKKYFECENVIRDLPLVTPTHKKSTWILIDEESNTWQCLRCKELGKDDYWQLNSGTPKDNKMDYCPYCGAKMEGEQSLNYVDQDTIMPAT